MLIRARQNVAPDPPRPPREGVAKNARHGRVKNETGNPERFRRDGPASFHADAIPAPSHTAAHIELPPLPKVPSQLLAGIQVQGHCHLLTGSCLERCPGLIQMFRDEETELPFRKRAQQLRMSIDKDPKVDRCLSID